MFLWRNMENYLQIPILSVLLIGVSVNPRSYSSVLKEGLQPWLLAFTITLAGATPPMAELFLTKIIQEHSRSFILLPHPNCYILCIHVKRNIVLQIFENSVIFLFFWTPFKIEKTINFLSPKFRDILRIHKKFRNFCFQNSQMVNMTKNQDCQGSLRTLCFIFASVSCD